MQKNWYQSKTVWTGVLGVLSAVAAFATGDADLANSIQLAITSLIGIFLRTAVNK